MDSLWSSSAQSSALSQEATTALPLGKQSNSVDPRSALECLPPELVLTIYGFLKRPAQVLFRMTCKPLRNLTPLPSISATHIKAIEDRTQISRLLEIDFPQYLTCHQCGILFKWQSRARFCYECPSYNKRRFTFPDHIKVEFECPCIEIYYDFSSNDEAGLRYISRRARGLNGFPFPGWINPEVVHLISRYYERGPHTGIPAGFLNYDGPLQGGKRRGMRARWVHGQLVVHIRSTFESNIISRDPWGNIDRCCHAVPHDDQRHPPGKSSSIFESPWDIRKFKCISCPCDVVAARQVLATGSTRMIVNYWINYGNPLKSDSSCQQLFNMRPGKKIDKTVVAQRDLRKLFDSGEDEEVYEEFRKAREELNEHGLPMLVTHMFEG